MTRASYKLESYTEVEFFWPDLTMDAFVANLDKKPTQTVIYMRKVLFVVYLTFVLLNQDMPCLCKQYRSRSEANWSGSALFVILYLNLYQQLGSSNLIGRKLEVGVAS